MSTNFRFSPFLRVQRKFPEEPQPLVVELDRAYTDIASAVNNRTISIFSTGQQLENGESWFLTSQRQGGLRQVYTFSAAANIPHGINLNQIYGFTFIGGAFTDGTVWYPLPYTDTAAVGNQVSVSVNATNIVITGGGGVGITKGTVVLEWLTIS